MKKLCGGLLMGVGILIAVCSGLCSLFVGISFGANTLLSAHSVTDVVIPIGVLLVVGGIPFGIGLGLFFAGRALTRSDD